EGSIRDELRTGGRRGRRYENRARDGARDDYGAGYSLQPASTTNRHAPLGVEGQRKGGAVAVIQHLNGWEACEAVTRPGEGSSEHMRLCGAPAAFEWTRAERNTR